MGCPLDWVAIDAGPVEAGGRTLVHKVGDLRTILLASTGLDLAEATKASRYDIIVADLPRIQDPREGLHALKNWLHTFHGIERLASERLSPEGDLILVIPDAALPWLAAATKLHIRQLIAWQKKYAPQNDSKSLLAPIHDFVVVLSQSPPSQCRTSLLHWRIGGKTEDATKQHAEDCASSERTATPPARLKPPALWAWMAANVAQSARSVLDLTASGFGICDHLPVTVERTDVVWDSDPDRLEILHLLKAARIGADERTKPALVGTACECASLEIEEPPRRSQSRSAFLKRVPEQAPDGQVAISTGDQDPVVIATHWLRGTVDLVTTTPDFAAYSKDLLTPDGVVMVALGEQVQDSLRLAIRTVPLAPIGHILFYEPEPSPNCSIWLVLVPWSQAVSRQRGRPVERKWSNPDGDPRGNWRDPQHKGAKGGDLSLSYSLMAPPYRWGIVSGALPPGMWRLNETTGVIWGVPSVPGTWRLEVTVSDQTDEATSAIISITVDPDAEMPDPPALSWLERSPQAGERLHIQQTNFSVPLGEEVAIELEALGGTPIVQTVDPPGKSIGEKRSRYWEFTFQTLQSALAEDRVIWPVDGKARKPRIKKFEHDDKERPTALRSCVEKRTGSFGNDELELRELVAVERSANIEAGLLSIFGAARSTRQLSNFTVEECAKCAELVEGTACTAEHAAQLAAYLIDPALSPKSPSPGWLNEFAPRLATSLLNDKEAVVITSGVLSDDVISAIRSWRPAVSGVLYSRALPRLVSGNGVMKIPEFQWTD
jgi:hypothetical protein